MVGFLEGFVFQRKTDFVRLTPHACWNDHRWSFSLGASSLSRAAVPQLLYPPPLRLAKLSIEYPSSSEVTEF